MGLIALAFLVPVVLCVLIHSWPGASFTPRSRTIRLKPTDSGKYSHELRPRNHGHSRTRSHLDLLALVVNYS